MKEIEIDDLDVEILSQVGSDGRKSYADIAEELGVSAGTIRNRLSQLQNQGTVFFVGRINPSHLGLHAYAIIHLRISPTSLINQVVEQLSTFPEVSFLATITGEYDLHMDVMCTHNDHLMALLSERVQKIEGVVDTKTTMMLYVHKYAQPDLHALQDENITNSTSKNTISSSR